MREGQIASRRTVTDQAIVEAVQACGPARVLDVGCGEGWLLRALTERGIEGFGIDGVEGLVERARRLGGGRFSTMSYDEFARGGWLQPVDVVVFNFSLLGEQATAAVVGAAARLLAPGGRCLIQTLHPAFCAFGDRYESGWREGSWAGFDAGFTDPHPWYFRRLSDWLALFEHVGLQLANLREPSDGGGGRPASIIFELQRGHQHG